MDSTSLGGHLLCAVPQLLDPNFRRSVVLLLEHNEEGALGLVLNNPLPNTVADVARGLDLSWEGDEDETVRLGGPVEPMRGWILHDQPDWDPTAEEVLPGVWLTTSLEPVTRAGHRAVGGDHSRVLFLLGYAGWAGSQLEGEIAAGSWLPVPIDTSDGPARYGVSPRWVLEQEPEDMWTSALRALGVDPGRLARAKLGSDAIQ
ncbi:MAG: YqgE/AlgH family protein [Myxococcales bacterium]|nr:YqgE/AlgH family protein [Myxococcales bacterium]MCB9713616.1 YqgE/AlgH family protein [Myxococcales bacterium]